MTASTPAPADQCLAWRQSAPRPGAVNGLEAATVGAEELTPEEVPFLRFEAAGQERFDRGMLAGLVGGVIAAGAMSVVHKASPELASVLRSKSRPPTRTS